MKAFKFKAGYFVLIALLAGGFTSPDADARKKRQKGKRVNVEKLKKQYWEQEEEYDVVQNRIYRKAGRMEVGVNGGVSIHDPFLSSKTLGGSVGYHFNEYLSVHALGWKIFTENSDAMDHLEKSVGATANTNPPRSFIGGEVAWSFVYGKLSLLGQKILYYDMHLLGGAGRMATLSGNNIAIHAGLGQQIWVNDWLAIRLDYRLQRYNESVPRNSRSQNNVSVGDRINWTNDITLGVSVFPF